MTASTGTRRIKTPLERAQEALDVARRAEVKATTRHTTAITVSEEATQALIAARQRLAYAGADPALPDQVRQDVREYLESLPGDGEILDTTGDHRAELEPVLLAYSEWLDELGFIDQPGREHDVLVERFLADDVDQKKD